MATPAHCYYCFESLAASYDGNNPINLAAVEELWGRYEQFKQLSALEDNGELLLSEESDVPGQRLVNDSEESGQGGQITSRPQANKLPSIDRLQAQVVSDSSVSTTPSAMSNKSSSSIFSTVTTSSTVSSQFDTPAGRQRLTDQKYPLFVTWNTLSNSGRKSLRGCIGTFEAQELSHGLNSYALTSAFDDTRFSPIPESLLPSLSCSLTLLGTFEPCTNALDWALGVHGIRISFIHRGRRYGATYLPDVPVDQGWTKEETVKSLMHKAGWDGPSEHTTRRFLRGSSSASHSPSSTKPWDQVSDFKTVKYQGLKSSASYAEWQEWRQWVLALEDGSEDLLT
ncbi:AMMECR1 domain-containing protein [Aspergillus cavernicola]|uniref:AMMECR1 domain-containing protein n=1 Tax=Aspergillus cavernicola TaxID=176166 RepID=A0ABR4J4V5_9EURO